MDPELFIEKKVTRLDEAATFEKAANCMQSCQLPLDIVKRIMTSNIREVQINLKNCQDKCQIGNSKEDDQIFSEEIYNCNLECLEKNKEIMKMMEKELGESIPSYKR